MKCPCLMNIWRNDAEWMPKIKIELKYFNNNIKNITIKNSVDFFFFDFSYIYLFVFFTIIQRPVRSPNWFYWFYEGFLGVIWIWTIACVYALVWSCLLVSQSVCIYNFFFLWKCVTAGKDNRIFHLYAYLHH